MALGFQPPCRRLEDEGCTELDGETQGWGGTTSEPDSVAPRLLPPKHHPLTGSPDSAATHFSVFPIRGYGFCLE